MIRVYHIQRDGTYQLVAHVKPPPGIRGWPVGQELEWAWEQTNSIHQEWRLNLAVEMQTEGRHRSSMVGDLFETDDGRCYQVAGMGFTPLDDPIEEILEDAEDVALARRRLADGEKTIPWDDVKRELGL